MRYRYEVWSTPAIPSKLPLFDSVSCRPHTRCGRLDWAVDGLLAAHLHIYYIDVIQRVLGCFAFGDVVWLFCLTTSSFLSTHADREPRACRACQIIMPFNTSTAPKCTSSHFSSINHRQRASISVAANNNRLTTTTTTTSDDDNKGQEGDTRIQQQTSEKRLSKTELQKKDKESRLCKINERYDDLQRAKETTEKKKRSWAVGIAGIIGAIIDPAAFGQLLQPSDKNERRRDC